MIEIKYSKYGLGNLIGDTIYLHQKLKDYPKLHDIVLDHEIKHIGGRKHVDRDEPFNSELMAFVLKHPTTWPHYLPLWFKIRNKKLQIIYNMRMMYFYGFLINAITCLLATIKWIQTIQ